MTPTEFTTAAASLGATIDAEALGRFERYHELLERANATTNLTRITGRDEVFAKHFLDSLSCLAVLEGDEDRSVVDVGSGAGLPGLAIAIVRPTWRVVLVESAERKAAFLRETAVDLGLANVSVATARAEDVGRDPEHRESYDVAVARAVARTSVLAEYLLPLVRIGGFVVAMKGTDPADELAETDLAAFGGGAGEVRPVAVPHVEGERHLVVVDKTAPTPDRYPRRPGVPAKRPVTRTPDRGRP